MLRLIVLIALLHVTSEAHGWELPTPDTRPAPEAAAAPAADPRTYPDADGFVRRVDHLVSLLAKQDLGAYRRGYFTGGDPGKYLPLHAMARLLRDPGDADVHRYINDERSYKEHYHFAAVNWARFLPLFGEVLTEQTQQQLAREAGRYTAYLEPRGTENHKVMWWTSANVLPHYLAGDATLARQPREQALAIAREQLWRYVKGLYNAGQGEWDSSTYLAFDLNGLLNIYDFSPDPEARLLARAALDWLVAGYALKHTDGLYAGPNQRGHARQAYDTPTDAIGYIWWGDPADRPDDSAMRYALHAASSAYRPNAVLTNIARRNLPQLPVVQHNTKPNYWHGLDVEPRPGHYRETLCIAPSFTLGSLANGFGGQMTRLQLVIATSDGPLAITGGSSRRSDHTGKPTGIGYADGIGRYDQCAQIGDVLLLLTRIPEDDAEARLFVTWPDPLPEPATVGDWLVADAGSRLVAVRPLGGGAQLIAPASAEQSSRTGPRRIEITGHRSGFLLTTVAKTVEQDPTALSDHLRSLEPDLRDWHPDQRVHLTIDGHSVEATFQPATDGNAHGERSLQLTIDGAVPDLPDAIYHGPLVTAADGVLEVFDGRTGFRVDFRADRPVYAPIHR